MRTRLTAGALAATLGLAGCATSTDSPSSATPSASGSKAQSAPIKILSPASGMMTSADRLTVTGTASPGQSLEYHDESGVQGLQTLPVGPRGGWTVTVLLAPGPNWIEFLNGRKSATLWVTRTSPGG
jgi:hypothetical protein